MWLYISLSYLLVIWGGVGIYVFSQIKKTYNKGAVFPRKLLLIWFVMWGFHHLAVILSLIYAIWLIPIHKLVALVFGLVICGVGIVILLTGMQEFRSLPRSLGQDASRLVTKGIYQWSRNPQFIGWFLVLLGISLMGRSGLAFLLSGMFVIVIHLYTIRMEEPYLERIFGEAYHYYKLRTPRYIGIPKESESGLNDAKRSIDGDLHSPAFWHTSRDQLPSITPETNDVDPRKPV
ncbi:MAG: methyltransferase family protein [Candidatus Heimdallarchaeota archaeon]